MNIEYLDAIGAILIITAYAMNILKIRQEKIIEYIGLNVIGASLIGIAAYEKEMWGVLALQIVWIVLPIFVLATKNKQKH